MLATGSPFLGSGQALNHQVVAETAFIRVNGWTISGQARARMWARTVSNTRPHSGSRVSSNCCYCGARKRCHWFPEKWIRHFEVRIAVWDRSSGPARKSEIVSGTCPSKTFEVSLVPGQFVLSLFLLELRGDEQFRGSKDSSRPATKRFSEEPVTVQPLISSIAYAASNCDIRLQDWDGRQPKCRKSTTPVLHPGANPRKDVCVATVCAIAFSRN